MNCRDIGEELMAVAAGAPAEAQVETHLRTCAACAQRLDEMRRTMAMLDEWKAPEPSPYFSARLRARVREEAARPRHVWLAWLRRPALAASLAALLVAGATLYRTSTDHPQPIAVVQAQPGTAVGDLEQLDKNHDLYANFDLLDDLAQEQQQQQELNVSQ